MPKDVCFDELQKFHALFSRLKNTEPDIAYCPCQAAEVSNQTFEIQKINELQRGIQNLKQNFSRTLIYSKLSPDFLELQVFADASYAT